MYFCCYLAQCLKTHHLFRIVNQAEEVISIVLFDKWIRQLNLCQFVIVLNEAEFILLISAHFLTKREPVFAVLRNIECYAEGYRL